MAKKLQSELFRSAATLKKQFYDHLSIVWDLSPTKQATLLKHLPKIVQATVTMEREILQQAAVKALAGDPTKASKAISVLGYFAAQWNPFRDSVNAVLKDVQNLGLFPDDAKRNAAATRFLRKYFKFLEEGKTLLRKNAIRNAFHPLLPSKG